MFSKTPSSVPTGEVAAPVTKQSIPALISADMRITGDLFCDSDLQIDGAIDGDVRSRMLTIGEKSNIRGAIQADSVRIRGTVTGQIHARMVDLTATARVIGDIIHESLSIEAGAHVEGNIKRVDASPPEIGSRERRVNLIQSPVPNPLSSKLKGVINK